MHRHEVQTRFQPAKTECKVSWWRLYVHVWHHILGSFQGSWFMHAGLVTYICQAWELLQGKELSNLGGEERGGLGDCRAGKQLHPLTIDVEHHFPLGGSHTLVKTEPHFPPSTQGVVIPLWGWEEGAANRGVPGIVTATMPFSHARVYKEG